MKDKIYVHIGRNLGLMQATNIPVTPGEEEYLRKKAVLKLVSGKKAEIIAKGWPKEFLAGFDIMCDELIADLKKL